MVKFTPSRFWIIIHPDSDGDVVAKFDTKGETTIPDGIVNYDKFVIESVADRESLENLTMDRSGLMENEKELLLTISPSISEVERVPNVGWAQVSSFDVNAKKPLQVERDYEGKHFQFWCYVTEDVVDLYQADELAVGDFVSIVYVDHDIEKPLVQQKIYKS